MAKQNDQLKKIDSIQKEVWTKLEQKKIYFGHQSVGFNIINGIKSLMKEHSTIKINLVETSNPNDFKDGIFAHSRVGENTNTLSKVESFKQIIENGVGDVADIAFFKLCYVDITEHTDVNAVFEEYKKVMAQLKIQYPKTIFVHFTVPLTVSKTTWKTHIKKLAGKKTFWEFADNIKRNQYNQLLLKEYLGKEPVFDIAEFESTCPDGKRESFEIDNRSYCSMVKEYTNDSGHLNEKGSRMVAEQFLIFLANAI